MILYEHPLSPYAQKVKIALLEKALSFEGRLPAGLGSGSTAEPAFVAGSPRGEVPLLVDGELAIFDSTVILEYLEEAYPSPPLRPSGAAERARARMIEEIVDGHYEAINWGLAEVRSFRRAEGELATRLEERAAEQTTKIQAWLGERLGGEPWFGGESFGFADLCVAPFVNGSVGFGLGPEPETPLGAWLARVNARSSVAQVLEQAREAASVMADVARLVRSGSFRREYRDYRLEWMIRSGGLEVVQQGLEKGNIRFNEIGPAGPRQ